MKTIEAKKRDLAQPVESIRAEGLVPAIVYGKGVENIAITVPENMVRSLWKDIKEKQVLTVSVDGTKHTVVMQDIQTHVVTGTILHIDFLIQA